MTTQLTTKQFKKLQSIQNKAQSYAWTLKTDWSCSKKLQTLHNQWCELAKQYGVLVGMFEVRYTTECGADYSHGYNFGDCLA